MMQKLVKTIDLKNPICPFCKNPLTGKVTEDGVIAWLDCFLCSIEHHYINLWEYKCHTWGFVNNKFIIELDFRRGITRLFKDESYPIRLITLDHIVTVSPDTFDDVIVRLKDLIVFS